MVDSPDIDKFDDVDSPAWDIPSLVNPSDLKDVDKEKLEIIAMHKRKIKLIEAVKKIILAVISSIPIIIAMLR